MRVIIRSDKIHFWLPIPLFLADTAVNFLPESIFEEMKQSIPPPYRDILTKQFLRELVRECVSVMREYRGLEIIHVEASDGTFVSIRL